jgi:hypothetical protein
MITAPKGYTPIVPITHGINVAPMREALAAHPELWNQRTERTAPEDSPHHDLDDIWCRFADMATMKDDGSHSSIWYQPANLLPVRDLVFPLMTSMRGEQLGGVLITRIPAGRRCRPHRDPGWHAKHYDKFAIQIDADPETQAFCFDGHELRTKPGDLYWFDNSLTHWVMNDGPYDRVTLIVCIRTERTGA